MLGRGDHLGPLSDPEILAYAIATYKDEFTLEPDADITAMERDGGGVAIRRTGANGLQETEHFDFVLATTGRTPNLTDMDLDKTTLELDAKGVPSFDPSTTRTAIAQGPSPILIAGDARRR